MEPQLNGFTVFALCHGDHPELAQRCIGSIVGGMASEVVRSIRVGLNAVSPATRATVRGLLSTVPRNSEVLIYDAGEHNRLKYPMMRKMFYDPKHPISTQFMSWFDDDSCLSYNRDVDGIRWWNLLHVVMQQADMVGALYRKKLEGNQAMAISHQPWYTRQQMPAGYRFTFATGGWWAVRTRIIQQHDYPFLDLTHNGGDTMLGELMRQQGYKLRPFREGVWINADERGNESKAPRRGVSRKPLWYDYAPGKPVDHSPHDFEIEATGIPVEERV